jgi:hypothetical protein
MPMNYVSLPDDIEQVNLRIEASDGFISKGVLYRTRGTRPDIVFHTMHPKSDQSQFYMIPQLCEAGFAVFGEQSRQINNDTAMVHEEVCLDVAASLRLLEELGHSTIIALGMSGGGPLYTMYQSQALKPPSERWTQTPGGDPPNFQEEDFRPFDAMVYLVGHLGPGKFLLVRMDPSVVHEDDPFSVDPELDMYDPANGFKLPPEPSSYRESFLTRFRAAQVDRVRRIDAHAQALLAEMRYWATKAGAPGFDSLPAAEQARIKRRAGFEPFLTIWRTSADPAFVDVTIMPSDRPVGGLQSPSALSPEPVDLFPHISNYATWGFGRLHTPRAWLSTWSGLSSNTATLDNITNVTSPSIFIYYTADTAIYPEHGRMQHAASAAADKEFHLVEGGNHYGLPSGPKAGEGRQREEAGRLVIDWTRKRFT